MRLKYHELATGLPPAENDAPWFPKCRHISLSGCVTHTSPWGRWKEVTSVPTLGWRICWLRELVRQRS